MPGLSEQIFTPDDIDNNRERVVEGPFTLTLVDVSHRTQPSGGLADLTSTLEVMVDDMDNGTNITCKGTTDEEYVIIYKRGIIAGTLKIGVLFELNGDIYKGNRKITENKLGHWYA